MDKIIEKLKNKQNLNFDESKSAFENIMSGKIKEDKIHNFLIYSSAKGETSDEIAGGVYVLRNKANKVNVPDDTIDTCGTGGDGKNTLNISTAAALLLSSFGVKIAKHGNKSVSSKCGSADVLENLNINIILALYKGVLVDHVSKAFFSFSTAVSKSDFDAKLTSASCFPDAGLNTLPFLSDDPDTTLPSIKCSIKFMSKII